MTQISDAFKVLSSDALKENKTSFLEEVKPLLESYNKDSKYNLDSYTRDSKNNLDSHKGEIDKLLEPLTKNLEDISNKTKEIENTRIKAYANLGSQLGTLSKSENELLTQVSKLSTVLQSSSQTRGKWGEIQLKNIVEFSGISEHCSFDVQKKLPDGSQPDMIVKLPGNRKVIIDAKTPDFFDLDESLDTAEKAEKKLFNKIREQLNRLGSKKYHESTDNAFDFVIMFLPVESIFVAALNKDPHIVERGLSNKVIIASPTTLIAILRTIAFSWQEEKLSQNAKEISKIGNELYKKILTFNKDTIELGKSLTKTVSKYNDHLRSYGKLIPRARKLKEMGASSEIEDLASPEEIDTKPDIFENKS